MAASTSRGPTHVALLRGVNLAGYKQISMADLRDLVTSLRFDDPQTLLQSGNVVFRCKGKTCDQIERQLEVAIQKEIGFACDMFVRTADEWRKLIAANPFPKEAAAHPGQLLVMCLRTVPTAAAVKAVQSAAPGGEKVRADGRHAYFFYPEGQGKSRLPHSAIQKAFGTGTARNWNTVKKLEALFGA